MTKLPPRICRNCGSDNRAIARLCDQCGDELARSTTQTPLSEDRAADLERPAVRASRILNQTYSVSYRLIEHRLREVGISPAQFRALSLVKLIAPPLTPGVLAMRLALDARTASDLIGRLEALGWMRRVRDLPDRRAARLELTEEGEAMLARAWTPNVQAVEEVWQSVTEDQLVQLIDVMVLVRDNCLARLGYSLDEVYSLGLQSPARATST